MQLLKGARCLFSVCNSGADACATLICSGPLPQVRSRDQQMVDAATTASGALNQGMDDESVPSMKRLRMSESVTALPDRKDDGGAAANGGQGGEDADGTGTGNVAIDDMDNVSMTE